MRMGTIETAHCCVDGASTGIAGWLSFAATPAFGAMALYTRVFGGPSMICSMMADAPPLGSMTAMYIMMGVFHAGPWLVWTTRWFARIRPIAFHGALPRK
jgi:hypothetical protein